MILQFVFCKSVAKWGFQGVSVPLSLNFEFFFFIFPFFEINIYTKINPSANYKLNTVKVELIKNLITLIRSLTIEDYKAYIYMLLFLQGVVFSVSSVDVSISSVCQRVAKFYSLGLPLVYF